MVRGQGYATVTGGRGVWGRSYLTPKSKCSKVLSEFLDLPLLNVGLLQQFKGLYFLKLPTSGGILKCSIKACSSPIVSPYLHSFLSNHFQEECHEYCYSGTDTSSHHHEQ